jgi:hypothetical protein
MARWVSVAVTPADHTIFNAPAQDAAKHQSTGP